MVKNVLVVVDMQKDFIDGALGSDMAKTIVNNVNQKIKEAEKNGDYIIFTRDTHEDNYMETEEGKNLPVPHCIYKTEGWEISKDIYIPEKAKFINKNTFGSYYLGNFLKDIMENKLVMFDKIELVGLCTDICVLANAVISKTFIPNTHIVVDASCCAGVSAKSHDVALEAMKTLQIEVLNQGAEPWRK